MSRYLTMPLLTYVQAGQGCWCCENPEVEMAFIGRASLSPEIRMAVMNRTPFWTRLCHDHEVELAALLLRWDR